MLYNKKKIRFFAKSLLLVLTYQLLYPLNALALSTGPTQPEVQSFEPVGTTDMVDLFTGDYVYNLPLLDVEGYPINISYHGGVGMEQEASWVGLGWNINPGAINRTVRGIPDDFNGDSLKKEYHIKDEEFIRIGGELGGETTGMGDPNLINLQLSIGANLNISNYRGMSADFNFGCGVGLTRFISAGVNLGVGSQSGASIDPYAGFGIASSQILGKGAGVGIGVNIGSGYNTMSGLKDISLNTNISVAGVSSNIYTKNIPIGIKNYVPVITSSSAMESYFGRIKIGGEFMWSNVWGATKGMYSKVEHDDSYASRRSYGYLYSENANQISIHDFSREKDGLFNPNMKYLPVASRTYDVFNVSGQGTGGAFRPFRNDFGSVFDPVVLPHKISMDVSAQLEASFGQLFAFGADISLGFTIPASGPWNHIKKPYAPKPTPEVDNDNNIFENVYFKMAGDNTPVNQNYWNVIRGSRPLKLVEGLTLPFIKPGTDSKREERSNLITYYTADEAHEYDGAAVEKYIENYSGGFGNGKLSPSTSIQRNSGLRKGYHLSEISQIQKDGRRYVYGLPVMNNVQREAVFSLPTGTSPNASGTASYNSTHDSKNNNNGVDNYYSSTVTPGYVHSYLLTNVFSADYIDIKGDGPTDDDLGAYNKFNYSLKSSDYRWRAPYDPSKVQHEAGYLSDKYDDKGSYIIGSREQWILHSIESKNYIAEFYTSERDDGQGVTAVIKGAGSTYEQTASIANQKSYKLDSIKLYNKHNRFIDKTNAVPIKTVFFVYDYSLCKGSPNSSDTTGGGGGKLTLKKIYTRYGNSNKSIASPYTFTYSDFNPSYSASAKDRWGNYKPASGGMSNGDFPYVDQFNEDNDEYSEAWSLTSIRLPSGGRIDVEYEADDYAYVQNKKAMEMFKIEGVGMAPVYSPFSSLYMNRYFPNSYIYFKRRKEQELYSTAKENYLSGTNTLYYNARVQLVSGKYEKIRGYANVVDIGYCDDEYGYVQLEKLPAAGGKAILNPITLTAINVGRYNLPHVIYDGFDPNSNLTNIKSVLRGMKSGLEQLLMLFQNPIVFLMKSKNIGRNINLTQSYIRLTSPDRQKEGGGHRVKSLKFYDSWNSMVGGKAYEAMYGKEYDYTMEGPGSESESSGVASYEPAIGSDENPLKQPVPYRAKRGSTFPPNDALDLYQESPVGESYFPPPVVGYRKVTVSSIHQNKGRSSQGVDIYTYYTAKEYPTRTSTTPLYSSGRNESRILRQTNIFHATQGFTIHLNDMHGKPRSIEQYLRKVKGSDVKLEKVRSKIYKYSSNNVVNVLEPEINGTSVQMKKQSRLLGVDADFTLDSRMKVEKTQTFTFNSNLNVSNILFVVIPIPLFYPWSSKTHNEFASASTTKIIQKYGILEEVEVYENGAITKIRNEIFDAVTGMPVVTSVNNEYKDKEFTINYPAYWAYKNMGPSYTNAGYEYAVDTLQPIYNKYPARLELTDIGDRTAFNEGDEVYVKYTDSAGLQREIIGYIHFGGDAQLENTDCCSPIVMPKFIDSSQYTPGWHTSNTPITNVFIKVLRPGKKNLLSEVVQTVTAYQIPIINDSLSSNLTGVVNISTKTFSESRLGSELPASLKLDSFSNGLKGIYRLDKEYNYHADRSYSGESIRHDGLFSVVSPWQVIGTYDSACGGSVWVSCSAPTSILTSSYMKLSISPSDKWKVSRDVTKRTPFGTEVENEDAIGNKSTAVYGYNEELPVAVAYNAVQGEVLAESFEDYLLLNSKDNFNDFIYSPFKLLFSKLDVTNTDHTIYNISSGTGGVSLERDIAHTGYYSLKTSTSPLDIIIDKLDSDSATTYNAFSLSAGDSQKYVLSYWSRPLSVSQNDTTYSNNNANVPNQISQKKSLIIDKWQQVEYVFMTSSSSSDTISLPQNCYIDDIRVFPIDANMKSFVYHPVNERLMATLDENNYATFYEYDAEGNLVRTKRETERGIITISESRSSNKKEW